jgi:ectoine hydroxylase-related dioxygenase (phytanoyl-CoA dioxygenase family)
MPTGRTSRAPIERLPRSTSPERVAEVLARDGCAVVERLAPEETMREALAELAPWLEATPTGRDAFAGQRTRRTGGLVARSATCRALVQHPLILATAKQLLTGATSFQLHLTQVIAIGPGEPGQPIHRDQWAFDFFPFPRGYEVQCNTIWAMSDFTAENGATRVIPGSHLFDDRLELGHDACEAAEMPAGSVFVYTGAVYHGGGANRSQATRYGLNLTYARSWLRQEENQYLSVPHEVARSLPDELLRLIGYQRGAYALGYVDDVRDPLEVLRGKRVADADAGRLGDLERAAAQLRGER